MNEVIPGGFNAPSVGSNNSVMATSTQMRELAETFAALQAAKSFPRDVKRCVENIMNECMNLPLAQQAVYQYARGGTDISGPSIHLAKAIVKHWGNCEAGIRELEMRNGETICEAFAWDKETNYRESKRFTVPHVRYTKSKGAVRLEDPRDLYELAANNGSRRERACILSIIPKWVVDQAVEQCENTIKASVKDLPGQVEKLQKCFEEFGVTKEQIEKRIQRRVDAMTAPQYLSLVKIGQSLRDGMSKPEEWFDNIEEPAKEAKPAGEGEPKKDLKSALGISGDTGATGSAEAAATEPEKKGEGAEPAAPSAAKPAHAHKGATGASGQMKMAF